MDGRFLGPAVSIYVAMILDGVDGRVARLTNTETDFGAEYDSLSDMISFGLAPALVMFQWSLVSWGKLGWLAALVYTATGATLQRKREDINIRGRQAGRWDGKRSFGLALAGVRVAVGGRRGASP